jgi:DNA-binding NarL/FixJ family response regulator
MTSSRRPSTDPPPASRVVLRLPMLPGRRAAPFSPGGAIDVAVGSGYEGPTLTIERGALEAHLAALTGSTRNGPIVFETPLELERGAGPALVAIIQAFRHEAARPDASPLLLAALRDALFTGLLTCARHNMSSLFERPADEPRGAALLLASLTPRERDVCDRVARGMLNKQIAAALGLSEWTVKDHRRRGFAKLGVKSAAELARIFERLGRR